MLKLAADASKLDVLLTEFEANNCCFGDDDYYEICMPNSTLLYTVGGLITINLA